MIILWIWSAAVITSGYGLPSMRSGFSDPIQVFEGNDALVTCVVRDIGSNTVLWKKEDQERHSTRVLTAGENRVTGDTRFSVLHDSGTDQDESGKDLPSGGDVWVLVIKNVTPSDSGMYVCEVNSNPFIRSFHKVNVFSLAITANPTDPLVYEDPDEPITGTAEIKNHNYTDCCVALNISNSCLGFCDIHSILMGNTGQDPEHCEQDFPSIVKCMADGRNHVPCCIHERVPDICQDVCRGEYTAITENIKTHFSCSAYTELTLACIMEGIELLPGPPENVEVETLSEKSIRVEWSLPLANSETITEYTVNITALKSFSKNLDEELGGTLNVTASIKIQKVPGNQNYTIVNDLTPFTWYEIKVISHNVIGTSLPTYSVKVLTTTPTKMKETTKQGKVPPLPDIKSCCSNKGIAHKTCLNKLCDPIEAEKVEITDLMICAPWAQDTFGCLANGIDHTPCCKERGLPDICQQLCTGNVSSLDFNYFKCLRYMGEYTNCLLEGYGVLPSAPTQVHITNVETEFALLHWTPPKTLGDTVNSYNVKIRPVSADEDDAANGGDEPEYKIISNAKSIWVLENLESLTDYEVFVEAVNKHGIGRPSSRLTFRTGSKIEEEKVAEAATYNVTACCADANLNSVCLPLCSYDANMRDFKKLEHCSKDFHTILRCAAGGRNHQTCCNRRGVPSACLSLCSGVIVDPLEITATNCVPYIGNIVQCFEEGTGNLPAPVNGVQALVVDSSTIILDWSAPDEGANVTDYVIHYQKVDNTTMHEILSKFEKQINTSTNYFALTGLESNSTYQIFVVARNENGTSLPSSIISIKLVNASSDQDWIHGVTSPPHSLAVATHSATWVTISWHPPEFSHPSQQISYRLYYKSTAEESYQIKNTSVNSYMIKDLLPNTQYIVYVVAITEKGPSMPSETLIAWTDPAFPAFVEPPTVHPINLVIEGSSMTIICIAMGNPMPTISLYISGRLITQKTTRHMVTFIHNVTRDMNQISCYADNGYGTPMQASRKIAISHAPHIQASEITMAIIGDSVTLECKVESSLPEPTMIFWKNHEERTPVIQGGKYDVEIKKVKDEEDKYIMQLTIKQIANTDVGDYYCHAENPFGKDTKAVSVRIRSAAPVNNVTQCCMEQNVTSPCMDACYFHLDIDAVIDKPECLPDFDKLMKCASDGSDHRICCAQAGVARPCLDWCRGEPVLNTKMNTECILLYTKNIMGCFQQMREKLPGPPQNLQVQFIDPHSVYINWDPPIKNAHAVESYLVFWKSVDSRNKPGQKGSTTETKLKLSDLKDGTTYEAAVKSINVQGNSVLSNSIKFVMSEKSLYITPAANQSEEGNHVGAAVAVVLAIAIVAAIVVAAVWFIRTKRMLGIKGTNGIAFENPSYLREVNNMDNVQIPNGQDSTTSSMNGSVNGSISVSSTSGGQGWKNEQLQVPTQEVNPTLYEELKLGQDGAGFKRLKP